jgi:streptomycin 6-kinase
VEYQAGRVAFEHHLAFWDLEPDGDPIATRVARLLPVRRQGEPAMLKIVTDAEARGGEVLLRWWNGEGAVRLLASDGDSLLLERAEGTGSLAEDARNGRDDAATAIICDVVARLHAPRRAPWPDLIPLQVWFRELEPAAATHGGMLAQCAATARALLDAPRDEVPLHGDIHHDNILDFGPRGWLAIDPNRIRGERGFDYANLFTNPDLADPSRPVAARHFARRLDLVSARAPVERRRLLQWIVAWCGLSAAWFIGANESAATDFEIAALALAALDG